MQRLNPLNDEDRRQWIENDEGLYNWKRSTRLSMRAFIKAHKAELDAAIYRVRDGVMPAHFLAYQHGADGKACACAGCRNRRPERGLF